MTFRQANKAMYALGRLKTGQMNRLETAYAAHLELQKHAGLVLWWKFEAVKLRLADNTFYTADFFLLNAAHELEAHETKGYMQDDANAKIKIAADLYPFRFYLVKARAKKNGGGFEIVQYGAKD